ncbi:thioredoxin domain-containing protein [Prosthecobacter sp. SYSU 5D2]|uniref:thioredoxin domain-containing protein n=1 Tax=Prosthecobacter sp. SYSU 5D2 TaxID=3134134 RepID=UPI0031FEE1DF
MSDPTPKHTNALIREKSPYLLQHAHNPVNWLPWGDEAIARAKAEDKPIFLSSGYSTCHWCHVMERESFENEEIAAYINEHFIPVKVDREERPDVDLTYMTYVQAASGGGGWPMSVFLTPDLKPFFGGTYFPPENAQGRIGFKNLLIELQKAWMEDREKVLASSDRSISKLQEYLDGENADTPVETDALVQKAYDDLSSSYDYHEAGFSSAPKFPRSSPISLLLRIHLAWQKDEARKSEADWAAEMSVKTLRAMANGGMWDHVGGGMHRYSVDGYWHIPHYEKMLYDQGQLLWAYADGYLITQSPFLADVARDIVTYVVRDMRHEKGGFYSAEDADSYAQEGDDHKKEGAFYVWKASEIDEILGKEEGSIFRYSFGARRDGNARPESDPHNELTGLNTLFRAFSIKKTAEFFKKTPEEILDIQARGLKLLFEARAKRIRPHLDDKIITAWNGLLISGLARAGAALGEASFLKLAAEAAQFLHDELCATPGKGLHRSWRAGERGPKGFAADYASLIHGLLDLYQAEFDAKWLQWAAALQEEMDSLFLDKKNGGYYSVHTDMAHSVLRIKEDYDGAEPSPNSLAALNLARLAAMLDHKAYADEAAKIITLFGKTLQESPAAVPVLVMAADFLERGKQQIVLAGDKSSPEFQALAAIVHHRLLPHAVLLHADGGAGQAWLGSKNEALAAMQPVNGKPAAYVCQNYTCQAPVTSGEALEKLLA